MWYIGATMCILNNELQKLFLKNESESLYKTILLLSLNIFASKDMVELYPSLIGGQWPNDDLVN